MKRRTAIIMGTLLLAATGGLLFQRCGEDVPEAGSSRGSSDGATPPPLAGLAPRGSPVGGAPPPPEPSAAGPRVVPQDEVGPRNTRTRGTVVDEDGRPISGATVVGEADVGDEIGPGAPVTTDAHGRFDIEVVNDDCATYTVSAPGFIERTLTRQSPDASGVVLRRENRTRVRLHVSGDVAEGDRFRWLVGETETQRIAPLHGWNRGGSLPVLPPESWDAEAPELSVAGGVIELPRLLSPGVSRHLLVGERGSVGPIWIHAPPRAGTLDVPVRILAFSRVEVLVTRAGTPVEKATVFVRCREIDRDLGGAVTDADGRVRVSVLAVPDRTVVVTDPAFVSVPLPDGMERLPVDIAPAEAERNAAARLREAPPPAPPSEGTILLDPVWSRPQPSPPLPSPPLPALGGVVGRIAAETWPPLERGFVTAVRWMPDRATSAPAEGPAIAGLGSSPRFQFDHLPPGRWLLFLRCGAFVATSDGPVEVRSGETADVGDLPLRRGAVLTGRVLDFAGAPRTFTRVVLADAAGALSIPAWTDPDGGYRVEGLWPGLFIATVGSEGEPGFVRAEVRVAGSAEHRLDLRPAPPR